MCVYIYVYGGVDSLKNTLAEYPEGARAARAAEPSKMRQKRPLVLVPISVSGETFPKPSPQQLFP